MAKKPAAATKSLKVASETLAWLDALAEHGLLVTARGKTAANPEVMLLVEALHTVLAGGKVTIKVGRRGDPQITKDLDAALEKAMKASTALAKSMRVMVP